jgi:hypothetical protein
MKPTSVHIATTEGPSEIQRITPEDCDVRSVICHDGKALALPISPEYDSFVRRPTGVIEACFGHSAYRVDVAHPIASGLSWQLGLFIAHALAEEGRLVRADDKIPQIVWATGEVTRDLAVDTVDDVDLKIRQSETWLRAHLERGSRVVLAVPVGNLIEANKALEDVFGDDLEKLHIVPARTVCEVLTALGLKHRRRTRQWLARTPSVIGDRRKMPRHLVYALSFTLCAVTLATGWYKLGPQATLNVAEAHGVRVLPAKLRTDPPVSLAAVSVVTGAPVGEPCAAVHFDKVAAVVTTRDEMARLPAAKLPLAGLCDFRYRLTNTASHPVTLWVMAQRNNEGSGVFRSRPYHAERGLAVGDTLILDARPPTTLSTPLGQSFIVLAAPKTPASDVAGIRAVWRSALATAPGNDLKPILDKARAHGAVLHTLTTNFTP